jgi:putative endonuclease
MNYVYILHSISHPGQFYTGLCKDVDARLVAHNAGQSPHTAKYKPWRLLSSHWFERPETAVAFERYLKTGSGGAFAIRHLR